jgi:hypothetical protein
MPALQPSLRRLRKLACAGIQVFGQRSEDVDGQDEPGHDELRNKMLKGTASAS